MSWWDRRSSGQQIAIFAGALFVAIFGLLGSLALFFMSAIDEFDGPSLGAPEPVTSTVPGQSDLPPETVDTAGSDLPPDTRATGDTLPLGSSDEVVWEVGTDIEPGLHRSEGTAFCFWERRTGTSDGYEDVGGHGSMEGGPVIADIDDADVLFVHQSCGPWEPYEIGAQMATEFGPGVHAVGDIAPGVYEANGGDGCYWARLGGFDGTVESIHVNWSGAGRNIVEISESDVGFESTRCGSWRPLVTEDPAAQPTTFNDGIHLVGQHIAPGSYRSAEPETCRWVRMSEISGGYRTHIEDSYEADTSAVTIEPDDVAFQSTHCGSWTPIR